MEYKVTLRTRVHTFRIDDVFGALFRVSRFFPKCFSPSPPMIITHTHTHTHLSKFIESNPPYTNKHTHTHTQNWLCRRKKRDMFYSNTFLARKGPLGTVWCAAHLQHRLKKSHITSTHISSTVSLLPFPCISFSL